MLDSPLGNFRRDFDGQARASGEDTSRRAFREGIWNLTLNETTSDACDCRAILGCVLTVGRE